MTVFKDDAARLDAYRVCRLHTLLCEYGKDSISPIYNLMPAATFKVYAALGNWDATPLSLPAQKQDGQDLTLGTNRIGQVPSRVFWVLTDNHHQAF